jgi:hypothetical protein
VNVWTSQTRRVQGWDLTPTITKLNRIFLVRFDMYNKIFGHYLAAIQRILSSVVASRSVERPQNSDGSGKGGNEHGSLGIFQLE